MATWGAESKTTTSKRNDEREKLLRTLSVSKFFDRRSPWILVPKGSFMGFFDWVPKHLREGPWSVLVPFYLAFLVAMVYKTKPESFFFEKANPDPYTKYWYYNLITFIWMALFLLVMLASKPKAVPFFLSTYTIQSWLYITLRHGLTALAPFLEDDHFLLHVNEVLRFQAVITATITFMIWNFVIAPVVAIKFLEKPGHKKNFVRWMFSFQMIQLHGFNIIFAILNGIIVSPRRQFTPQDLWCSIFAACVYAFYYVMVLDRLGIHLYPIFSPRSTIFLITWTIAFGAYYGGYVLWNRVIWYIST